MLFSVHQVFVGRDEKRAPLKTTAWEAKRIAQCKGIQDSFGFWIPYGGFRIPIINEIPNSWSCIPDSKAQVFPNSTSKNFMDSGYQKREFPGFSNLDSLT